MKLSRLMAAIVAATIAHAVAAADMPEFTLMLKNHVYQPSELKIPAGTKIKLHIANEDSTPEEFESTDFNRESVVLPHHSIVVFIGPLRAGTYGFFGDFHRDTAQGRLIVE